MTFSNVYRRIRRQKDSKVWAGQIGTFNVMLFLSWAPLDSTGWLTCYLRARVEPIDQHLRQLSGPGGQLKEMGLFSTRQSRPFILRRYTIGAGLCNMKYTEMKRTFLISAWTCGELKFCIFVTNDHWHSDFQSVPKITRVGQRQGCCNVASLSFPALLQSWTYWKHWRLQNGAVINHRK